MTPIGNRTRTRAYSLLVGLSCLVITALFSHTRAYSSNDASRLAAIESLVQRGTWAIDESPLATVDRIQVNGHFYSDKPPILSLAGAGVYAILHHGFNLELQPWGCTPERVPTWCLAVLESTEADWAYFILTLTLCGLPAALLGVLIYRLARRYGFSNWAGSVLALVMILGTAIWPYATVFTNHVPAAAATLTATYVLLPDRLSRPRAFLAGFMIALAAAIDLSIGIYAVGLAVWVAARHRSGLAAFSAGASVPIAVAIVLNFQIVGNALPPQLYAPGYVYAGSEFGASVAGNQRAADVARYTFDLFVGERGVLAFFPIVLWYLYATLRAARSTAGPVRWLARLILISSAIYTLYFVLGTDNFGGYAYSPRWLLNPVPLLALFSVIDPALYRPRWKTAVFGALAAISIGGAFFGALNPWSPAAPVLRLAYTAPVPPPSVAVATSGYSSFNEVPADWRKLIEANNVVPRRFDARRGLIVLQGAAWYFIADGTPLAAEIAQPLGLGVGGPLALHADLTPQVAQWLTTFERPAASRFGEELNLIAYRIDRVGAELHVITAWQIRQAPQPFDQRRIVIEVIAADERVLHTSEVLAARYGSLRSGDVLLQVQTLPVTDAAGAYRVRAGVLNLDTGARLPLPDGGEWVDLPELQK